MTIDAALEIVQQTEECWVVFNRTTGEVLSVVENHADETSEKRFAHLGGLSSFNQPVKTRYFKSAQVTREILEREQGESDRIRTRVQVLTEWSRATTEQLVQVLECGQYDYPMNKDFDSRIIVEHLWELHRGELDLAARGTLAALLSSAVICEAARNKLRIYLAALGGDEKQLRAIWKGTEPGHDCWADGYALMDAWAHVGTKDQEIIGEILGVFDTDMPFGGKFDTMVSLGKIGPAAGERAAAAIRRTIHDSQPWVVAVRDRVLERVVSSEDAWTVCGECCYGQIHSAKGHGMERCSVCLGLGYRHIDGQEAQAEKPSLAA